MANRNKIIWLAAALVFHVGIYVYLDKVLLAPEASYQVSAAAEQTVSDGKAYYSRNRSYMANVKQNEIEILEMPGKKLVRSIPLGNHKLSYFKWLEDRDLALMGMNSDAGGLSEVVLTQVNPHSTGHELSTTISKLPLGSKISDVAYSTATNVIYIQVQTSHNPDLFRVYRTDANQELARIFFNTNRIGRIGVLYDHDALIFDDLEKNTVLVRNGDGSWRVISPSGGKYRLIGVDLKNNIYIARLNENGLAETVFKGKLGMSFSEHRKLNAVTDAHSLKVSDVIEANR